ncbi:MAG TPA: hypothetical protein VJ932_02900 [Alkalispirochaeta sp.]|nr:hypothetical protein [Alkalispirochaeta sp.]
MSTLQERLADQLAALMESHDSEAARHFAEHLVRYFVTRETGVDEDLVTRIDNGFASAAADRQDIRDEVRDGFTAAATDRARIEQEAAADRQDIRDEMREGFAAAATDREDIRREMRAGFESAAEDRQRIEREAAASREELRDSLVAAIERSAATTKEDLRQEISRLADGMAMFQDAVNRRLAQMTWVTGLLFGSITILLALRGF